MRPALSPAAILRPLAGDSSGGIESNHPAHGNDSRIKELTMTLALTRGIDYKGHPLWYRENKIFIGANILHMNRKFSFTDPDYEQALTHCVPTDHWRLNRTHYQLERDLESALAAYNIRRLCAFYAQIEAQMTADNRQDADVENYILSLIHNGRLVVVDGRHDWVVWHI